MSRPLPTFDEVVEKIHLDQSASPSAALTAAVQLWLAVPAVDSDTVPHAVVPSIVLRWVVSPYAPITAHSVELSPVVARSTRSTAGLPRSTQALCPSGSSPAVILPNGGAHSSLGLKSGQDVSAESARVALCIVDATALLDMFLQDGEIRLPVPETLVHDVLCVNVDPHPEFAESATLQLAAAVSCVLKAAAVHFSGTVEEYTAECLGNRRTQCHPPVVDLSGLTELDSFKATEGYSPWRNVRRLILPPLSPDGHGVDAHFGVTPLDEIVFGSPQRPSKLEHLGNNGFCFARVLEVVDFRCCPELRNVGSLVFQGSDMLRIVCLRGLPRFNSFGKRPFVYAQKLEVVDLRDISFTDRTQDAGFSNAFKGVVLVSPGSPELFWRPLFEKTKPDQRFISPGTEDQYPAGALVRDEATGQVALDVALTEVQYRSLPPSAPISTHFRCLCEDDPTE